jgi:hypothetical protein
LPGEPNLRNKTYKLPGGCARATVLTSMKNDDLLIGLGDLSASLNQDAEAVTGQCRQLNGINLGLDNAARKNDPSKVMNVPDVKVQYRVPPQPCSPCDVSYSVSAKIQEDEYIAVGFKGQSWEHEDPYPPENSRPCYFGMCVDSYDNFTSDRIALGFTSNGGCVREMTTDKVIGAPVDVDYKILKATSIERAGDRTILRFTVSQHWPKSEALKLNDGPWRMMWAIGKVFGPRGASIGAPMDTTCKDVGIGYHSNHRGVSPLEWLLTLGSTPCNYSSYEMDSSITNVVV